ncbi:OmpH family outer membrane protein [Odoribacter laneus]
MRNKMKWLLLAVFTMAALGASAQQRPVKLGHIESSKLIAAMPEMAAAQKQLETKQDDIQKESQNLRTQWQNLVTDYQKNEATYSDIIKTSKQQEIEELGQRIQKFEEIAMNEFKKAQDELLQPIMDKAHKAIQDVAKENSFTYIFDMNSGAILYASETSEDILPLVKKKLGIQ